jgi:urea transporter
MIMIASLASAGLAVLLALAVGDSEMLIISAPGFAIGGFFAFKYARYDKISAREEEHRRNRRKHKH